VDAWPGRTRAPAGPRDAAAAHDDAPVLFRRVTPLPDASLLFQPQRPVALVPLRGDLAGLDRLADGAVGLVDVGAAVAETALAEDGSELGEVGVQRLPVDAPEAELPQAGRVRHVPAAAQRDQLRGDGG